MSEKQWTIAGVVAAVVFGAPSWWVMFIEHPETAGMMVTALRVISPVVMFAIGAFTGYKYCSWKSSERRATELAAKDAEIAELRQRPTPGEIEAAQSAQGALDEYDRVRRAVADLLAGSPELVEPIVDTVMAEQERAMGSELAAVRSMRARVAEISREQERVVDAVATGALRPEHIGSRMTDLDAEREALEAELAEAERGAPVIEPDMVRYMLHKLAQCEGPDAVVRGFVSRVVVDADGSMWVGFTVNPDGGPPDGRALVRVKSHPGSHCYLTRTPYVIAVRGGFFLSC